MQFTRYIGGRDLFGLIESIVKSVRKEKRVSEAGAWAIVDAAVTLSRFEGPQFRLRPVIVFSYEVNSETFYGSCLGSPANDASSETLRSAVTAISTLRVRYDPSDPGMNRVLNRDNSGFPFEIDYEPY